jgi:hypothetical protein
MRSRGQRLNPRMQPTGRTDAALRVGRRALLVRGGP